jgi:hypothetical protein
MVSFEAIDHDVHPSGTLLTNYSIAQPESVLDSLDLDSLDEGSAGGTTLSGSSQAGLIIKNAHVAI